MYTMVNPEDKKIKQIGLTTNSDETLQEIADKVDKFNRSKDGIYVQLEYMEAPVEERVNSGKWRMEFTFANRMAQQAFWLGNW